MDMLRIISRIREECPICGIEKNIIYGEIKEGLKVRGEDIEVFTRVHYCPDGDHSFYSIDDEDEKFQLAYTEYRKRKGLLQPIEIKQIREKYGLSQRAFARLLGWGEITIHRYESGAIQDDVHNDLLLMIRELENFKKYFITKRNSIEPAIANKVENKIIEIEKERISRTFDLLIKLFSSEKQKNILLASKIFMAPYYWEHSKSSQYRECANEELALAA